MAEKKISLSSDGYPTNVFEKNSLRSNELIEMTMILSNLCVSQTLSQSITKFLSRYHEIPDKHALKDLNIFTSLNDLATIREKQVTSNSFNELLKKCKYPEKKKLLSNAVLRILPKAKYSDVDAGHFGLNLPLYCHFTSPIRRYADLTVHRSLAFALKWEMDDSDFFDDHKAICQIINESEKKFFKQFFKYMTKEYGPADDRWSYSKGALGYFNLRFRDPNDAAQFKILL